MSEDCDCSIILEEVIDNGIDGHIDVYGIEYCPKHARVDELLAALLQVEWVSTPYQMDEDTYYCPWCRGVRPNQWKANYKAQEMETCIGHAEDCPRQAAIAKAKG